MQDLDHQLASLYPVWAELPLAVREQCLTHARHLEIEKGGALFEEEQLCRSFPLLLQGRLKVSKPTPNGRELLLYRLFPGESCVISSVSLLAQRAYGAQGRAETDSSVLLLDTAHFHLLMQQEPFRHDLFRFMGERITELMSLVEEVLTHRLDQRLASLLLGHGQVVSRTHQELADELGTVREMVSRLLKSFEAQGLIALGREKITIRNPGALRRLSC